MSQPKFDLVINLKTARSASPCHIHSSPAPTRLSNSDFKLMGWMAP
jgi:hypothetical protein